MAKKLKTMQAAPLRALLGFMIAAISMLTFYQAMWEMLHILKIPRLVMPAPFPLNLVPPWGLPRTANLCLWGGIFGAVFGVALPRFTFPLWFCGLGLGALMGLVDMVFFPELTGSPAGYEWSMQNWVKAMLLDSAFGVGVGIIAPLFINGTGGWINFRQP